MKSREGEGEEKRREYIIRIATEENAGKPVYNYLLRHSGKESKRGAQKTLAATSAQEGGRKGERKTRYAHLRKGSNQ